MEFGRQLAIAGNRIVVGARYEKSNARGIDGNPSDASLSAAGAAYVFEHVDDVFRQKAYLRPPTPAKTNISASGSA